MVRKPKGENAITPAERMRIMRANRSEERREEVKAADRKRKNEHREKLKTATDQGPYEKLLQSDRRSKMKQSSDKSSSTSASPSCSITSSSTTPEQIAPAPISYFSKKQAKISM